MLVLNKSSWHGLGASVAGLGVCLMQPLSRGTLALRSADPSVPPEVNFRMLAEDADRHRLVKGFDLAAQLMLDPEVRSLRHESFAAGYSRVVRGLNKPGTFNFLTANVLAWLLDGPPAVRRGMLRWGIAKGDTSERRLSDPGWLADTVRRCSFGTCHPAGTCALGPVDDSQAVVDARARVMGAGGLRVVDASIMPVIPRANTNLPVMMLAERAVALIIEDSHCA